MFSLIKSQEKLDNTEIILEDDKPDPRDLQVFKPEKPPERPLSRLEAERREMYLVSLATLVIVILISVTLLCLLTLMAYKTWQVKHRNIYWVN